MLKLEIIDLTNSRSTFDITGLVIMYQSSFAWLHDGGKVPRILLRLSVQRELQELSVRTNSTSIHELTQYRHIPAYTNIGTTLSSHAYHRTVNGKHNTVDHSARVSHSARDALGPSSSSLRSQLRRTTHLGTALSRLRLCHR